MSEQGRHKKRKILWYWCCFCLVPFTVFSLYTIPEYIQGRREQRPDYEYPSLADFKITLYSLLFFIPTRIVCTDYLLKILGNKIIPSAASRGWTDEQRQAR